MTFLALESLKGFSESVFLLFWLDTTLNIDVVGWQYRHGSHAMQYINYTFFFFLSQFNSLPYWSQQVSFTEYESSDTSITASRTLIWRKSLKINLSSKECTLFTLLYLINFLWSTGGLCRKLAISYTLFASYWAVYSVECAISPNMSVNDLFNIRDRGECVSWTRIRC